MANRTVIPAPRRRVIVGEEFNGKPAPEVIRDFTLIARLAPGSVNVATFFESPGPPRRIPISRGRVDIMPGQTPQACAPSQFVIGSPHGPVSAENMNFHELEIRNFSKRAHLIQAKAGVPFGGLNGPLVVSMPQAPLTGGIFRDGEAGGDLLEIGPFGNVALIAMTGRWIVKAGRNFKLK